ncbi:hypothetical protein PENSPDRAFT_755617 [Peniophora sp. CONT]|nr:hypothetical protein PENSPDRAFT_755617 [Peniophora sp. CONT]
MLQRLRQKLQPSDDAVRIAKLGLRLTLEVAERACDGLPIPAAQGSITALLAVLRGIERMSRNAEALEELSDHVRYIHQEVVLPVQDALEKAEASAELQGVLTRFGSDLDTAMEPWRSREPQNFVKRLVTSEDQEGEIQKLASSIKMVIERYQLSAHVRGELALVRLEGKTAHVSQQIVEHGELQDSRERNRLINTLPRAVKASYDSCRESGLVSCLPGTRVTVLSDLQNWLEDPHAPHTFWLNGLAGTGKSTIAKSIAESAFVRDYLGATFFCSALADGSLANPDMIISTLAHQLSRNIPRFKSALADALEEDPDLAHRDLETQILRLLIEPLKVVTDFDVILLVIDGLDECLPERTCASLLRSLLTHVAKVPDLRVLVSCRPEHHLRAAFAHSTAAYQQLTLHDVEASLVRHDIHLYLHSALVAIPRDLDIPDLLDWPRDCDVAALADKSGQLFVYAATAVRFIAHDRVRDPQRQLEVLLGMRSVTNGNPYSQLDSLYLHLLSSALPDDSEPEDVERFKRVLGTILCSREALPISALSCFAGIDSASVLRTLYHLHSVIVSSEEAPRVYHPSFAEFITDPRRCTERFCIYPEAEEQHLAARSLDLLANGLQRGMSLAELTPQMRYACRYWAVHVDACSEHDAVVASVEAFAHDNLVFWLEAMCNMDLLYMVPALLAGVHKWMAMSCTQSGQVVPAALELLDDAYRLALVYREVVHGAPEHIYLSALPFSPSSSALFQTYEAEAIDGVIVLRPFERHWTPLLRSLDLQSCETPLRASALSPTGSVIALVRMSGCLELLDMDAPSAGEAKSQLLTLSMNTRDATDHRLAFSSSGKLLACAYVPNKGPPTIDVWDVASHTLVHTSSEQSTSAPPSTTIAVARDGLHVAAIALDVKVMHLSVQSTRKKERVALTYPLSSQTSDPCLIFYETTGVTIAIGTCDGVFILDDLVKRSPIRLRPHSGAATAIAVTHDSSQLAATFRSAELALALWDTTNLLCLYSLSLSSNPITSLAFREDGGQLALGSQNGQLILYEREDSTAFAPSAYVTIAESQTAVTGIAYSSDAIRLHTGTAYGVYKQWHLRDLSRSPPIVDTLPIGLPEHCAFSANGAFIALPVGEYTVSAAVYDARTGAHILDCTSSPHTHWDAKMDPLGAPPPIRVTALAFSPDGTILAAACASERTYALFWDTKTGILTRTLNLAYMGLHVDVSALSFSADNSVLYAHLRQSTTLHLPGTRVFQPPAPGKLAYNLRTNRMPALLPERNADEEDPEALHVWVDEEDALRMRHADMVFEDSTLLARLPAGTIKRAFGYGDRVVGVSPAGKVCILDISNFV